MPLGIGYLMTICPLLLLPHTEDAGRSPCPLPCSGQTKMHVKTSCMSQPRSSSYMTISSSP
jgi:hypothetical protein